MESLGRAIHVDNVSLCLTTDNILMRIERFVREERKVREVQEDARIKKKVGFIIQKNLNETTRGKLCC